MAQKDQVIQNQILVGLDMGVGVDLKEVIERDELQQGS